MEKFLKQIKPLYNPDILVGFDKSDDACVIKVSKDAAVIHTVDFFPPIVDDPYMFGQIAAANALSDVYAMGGTPVSALNVLCITNELDENTVSLILKGGADKVAEAQASVTGGHTIKSREPIYGLSVTGYVHPDRILTNSNCKTGDILILTKKLGIGLITTAAKADFASKKAVEEAQSSMAQLNKLAKEIMLKYKVHSCTDITGFGLAGHAVEMADGSNLTLSLYADKIPYFEEAYQYANLGMIPEGSYRNRENNQPKIEISLNSKAVSDGAIMDIIYDPQTSGGLLISIDKDDAQSCLEEMIKNGLPAQIVGTVTDRTSKSLIIL